MSIKVDNISKFFQDQKILDSITFEAKAGDIVGILGPNGAGKSTMMKIITGYYKQNQGNVFICGKNNLDHEIFTKSKTGYLSEENPLYGDMYVIEFLEFTLLILPVLLLGIISTKLLIGTRPLSVDILRFSIASKVLPSFGYRK